MSDHIFSLIKDIKEKKIAVIGDAMLDTYIHGTAQRISREAPVQIVAADYEAVQCGGAANTASNVASLGAETYFIGAIGNDENGRLLCEAMENNQVKLKIVETDTIKTIAKKRIVASSHLLLRLDEGKEIVYDKKTEKQLLKKIKNIHKQVDALILSDYGYGTISTEVIQLLEELQYKNPKIIVIDAKEPRLYKTLTPTAVKPSYSEMTAMLSLQPQRGKERVKQILENSRKILDATGAYSVSATCDKDGTVILQKGKKPYIISATPRPETKANGAGDTFVAALTCALATGATPQLAGEIAAAAAAIVLNKDATALCTQTELLTHFADIPKHIEDRSLLKERVEELRKQGKKIVFTNGCFDILHRGHVTYLQQAREQGDFLILGINSDKSIKRLKGPERPINTLEDRIAVLAGLSSIDMLVPFSENTPIELIEIIRPDIFVKGGDYTVETLPEAPIVKKLGGEIKIIPFVADRSTTKIIKRIRESENAKTQTVLQELQINKN